MEQDTVEDELHGHAVRETDLTDGKEITRKQVEEGGIPKAPSHVIRTGVGRYMVELDERDVFVDDIHIVQEGSNPAQEFRIEADDEIKIAT